MDNHSLYHLLSRQGIKYGIICATFVLIITSHSRPKYDLMVCEMMQRVRSWNICVSMWDIFPHLEASFDQDFLFKMLYFIQIYFETVLRMCLVANSSISEIWHWEAYKPKRNALNEMFSIFMIYGMLLILIL